MHSYPQRGFQFEYEYENPFAEEFSLNKTLDQESHNPNLHISDVEQYLNIVSLDKTLDESNSNQNEGVENFQFEEPYDKFDEFEDLEHSNFEYESYLNGTYDPSLKEAIQNKVLLDANKELELWREKTESNSGMYVHIARYWIEGVGLTEGTAKRYVRERAESIKMKVEAKHPWSAAFISYLMRRATGGIFPEKMGRHTAYAQWASKERNIPFTLLRPDAPNATLEIGDILINVRGTKVSDMVSFDTIVKTGEGKSHGDIVIFVDRKVNKVTLIGGNKDRTVKTITLDTLPDGRIKQVPFYYNKIKLTNEKYIAVVKLMPPVKVAGVPILDIQRPQTNEWINAIRLNKYYGDKLGWNKLLYQINDFLLPYSKYQNVSLSEEAFAEAVAAWQRQQGFNEKDCDGIIGPKTWNIIRSLIQNSPSSVSVHPDPLTDQATTEANSNLLNIRLGTLTINTTIPALSKSIPTYSFTPDDAIWLARFVEGEAGGRNNADNHAVIWAMFNRFGMLRHRVKSWVSFGTFLQLYSTTLQPLLNSVGAARRVWANHNSNKTKYPVVSSDLTYKIKDKATGKEVDTGVRKVQYQKHITLQKKTWRSFSFSVRNLVVDILTGKIQNPGIGIATHFASTYVFQVTDRRKKGNITKPTYEEWKAYTQQYATQNKLIWIGERSNLNQQKNAFFIQPELKDVPPDAVKVKTSALAQNFELYETDYMEEEHLGMDETFYYNDFEQNELEFEEFY